MKVLIPLLSTGVRKTDVNPETFPWSNVGRV